MKVLVNKVLGFMGGVIPLAIASGGVFLLFLITGIICAVTKNPTPPQVPPVP